MTKINFLYFKDVFKIKIVIQKTSTEACRAHQGAWWAACGPLGPWAGRCPGLNQAKLWLDKILPMYFSTYLYDYCFYFQKYLSLKEMDMDVANGASKKVNWKPGNNKIKNSSLIKVQVSFYPLFKLY